MKLFFLYAKSTNILSSTKDQVSAWRGTTLNCFLGIVECDAGLTLHELDERLEPHGYVMPIDLGARGSCCIGGNIATNAGGIRLIRYGSLNANVLSLQVVSP
jgi:FAD/FMN-containing dehydrogenase